MESRAKGSKATGVTEKGDERKGEVARFKETKKGLRP
jgi:hypothetical protein